MYFILNFRDIFHTVFIMFSSNCVRPWNFSQVKRQVYVSCSLKINEPPTSYSSIIKSA